MKRKKKSLSLRVQKEETLLMFQYGTDATRKKTEMKERSEELWFELKVENYMFVLLVSQSLRIGISGEERTI